MSNLKDVATTIAGFVFSISTAVLTYTQSAAITLPTWLTEILGTAITISGGVIFYLTGKNPDGSAKTPT